MVVVAKQNTGNPVGTNGFIVAYVSGSVSQIMAGLQLDYRNWIVIQLLVWGSSGLRFSIRLAIRIGPDCQLD